MSANSALTVQKKCYAYPFSNDKWSPDTIRGMQAMLLDQQTPPEASAALVVGSGGLPYLLGRLDTRRVFGVDLSQDVLDLTSWRSGQLDRYTNWDDYHFGIDGDLTLKRAPRRHEYVDEYLNAELSGLQGDYTRTRVAANATEFTFVHGDLRETAAHVGGLATQEDREFTFVNFTNVANYTGHDRAALHAVLDSMPMADDAVIIDSSPDLHPRAYLLADYMQL